MSYACSEIYLDIKEGWSTCFHFGGFSAGLSSFLVNLIRSRFSDKNISLITRFTPSTASFVNDRSTAIAFLRIIPRKRVHSL